MGVWPGCFYKMCVATDYLVQMILVLLVYSPVIWADVDEKVFSWV